MTDLAGGLSVLDADAFESHHLPNAGPAQADQIGIERGGGPPAPLLMAAAMASVREGGCEHLARRRLAKR